MTVTDAIIAFPFAYFMARMASSRTRAVLFVLVLLPLWASYLARVYAWRLILNNDGLLNWSLHKLGLPSAGIAYTNTAMWIVFSYIWLPFMILPVYAALERIPHSYIEASRDLGAKGSRTLRSVILPLALPGVVAGSIFTFSLTLGDYITPVLIGGASSQFIGNVVYDSVNQSSNLPFAAAFAVVPLAVMGVYLDARAPPRRVRGALVVETPRHAHRARRLGGARARVPLHPDRRHLPLRVQLVERAELADRRADDEVVLAGDPQRRHAAGALALAEGGGARHDDRARARLGRVVRRAPLPLLRPRVDLVPARAADRAAGDHHGHGAELVLHLLEVQLRALDDRDRPRDLLRRRRLQQRARPPAPRARLAHRGVDGPRRRRHRRRSATSRFPTISTALISGGLLAFALSFDEVIVTTFTAGAQNTLPIWIFGQIRLGQQLPQVNVVVFIVLAVTIIPVVLAQRLTRESGILRTE